MVSLEQSDYILQLHILQFYFTIQLILYSISNNTEVCEGVVGLRWEVEVVPLPDGEKTVVVDVNDGGEYD